MVIHLGRTLPHGSCDLTREAAHSRQRILHARDATGAEIVRALGAALGKVKGLSVFEKSFAVELVVEAGRLTGVLVCHADADTSRILGLIREAGFHMAECFVTAPMVPMTLSEARATLGTDVIIWGGIPSMMLCDPISDGEFETYMRDVFRTIAPGDAFILGVADNVMPESKLERVERVSEMVEAYGKYPIVQ